VTDVEQTRMDEIRETAVPAERDTEAMLQELDTLAALRRPDPLIEARYTELRDLLTARLLKEGPRYYLDAFGEKRYAYAIVPEPVEVDVDELIKMNESGEISDDLLNEVAPRKVDKEAFTRAAARGTRKRPRKPGITPEQLIRVAKKRPGTGHVRFAKAENTPDS
jgi:hypothetical protein